MVIIVSCLILTMTCSADRAPRQVIVSPGITVFELADDVRPGDMIICRASNGDAGVVVPEPEGGAGLGSDIDVEVDPDGRITVHCTRAIAQA